MTTLQLALAKVARPITQRVWEWVQLHPGKCTSEIAAGLNINLQRASDSCSQLGFRGMMEKKPSWSEHKKKQVIVWHAIGREYVLLPKVKGYKPSTKLVQIAEPVSEPGVQPVTVQAPCKSNLRKEYVSSLTIAEAQELRDYLNRILPCLA